MMPQPDHACREGLKFTVLCYALFAGLVLTLSGANRVPELALGYWFAPLLYLMFFQLMPYITTYCVAQSNANQDDYILQSSPWMLWLLFLIQVAIAVGALVVNLVFFILRLVDLFSNCDVGSNCQQQMTSYVVCSICAALCALLGLVMLYQIARCKEVPQLRIKRNWNMVIRM